MLLVLGIGNWGREDDEEEEGLKGMKGEQGGEKRSTL